MAKVGIAYKCDIEFTDAEVIANPKFKFPCSFEIVDGLGNIIKKVFYDLNGVKSVVVYGGGSSKASDIENDSSVLGTTVKDAFETLKANKLDKPTTTGNFTSHPNIIAVNGSGETAKVNPNGLDFVTALFQNNAKWVFPKFNTNTYDIFRANGPLVVVGGASNSTSYPASPGIIYTSSGGTLAFQRGLPMTFYGSYHPISYKHIRKFSINSTVSTQRLFVGLANSSRITNPINVALTTLTRVQGVCMQSGDSKIYFIWNNDIGSATLEDTGFTNSLDYNYQLTLINNRDGLLFIIKLERFHNTNGYLDTVIKTFAGSEIYNGLCSPVIWCVDSATTSPVVVTDYGMYEEQRKDADLI